jgi:amino acid permease
MGLDPYLLVPVPWNVKSRCPGIRRSRILVGIVRLLIVKKLRSMLIFHRIKVISLIVFFILAICISSGGIGPQKIGFKYWHEPGAFADSINGVAKTFVVAGTLYAGTEM